MKEEEPKAGGAQGIQAGDRGLVSGENLDLETPLEGRGQELVAEAKESEKVGLTPWLLDRMTTGRA